MQIVWFKRDLRVVDHEALSRAVKFGPVLPLYILEPELWGQSDMSGRHYKFLQECLDELDHNLGQLGQNLVIKIGDVVRVFDDLKKRYSKCVNRSQVLFNTWTTSRGADHRQLLPLNPD